MRDRLDSGSVAGSDKEFDVATWREEGEGEMVAQSVQRNVTSGCEGGRQQKKVLKFALLDGATKTGEEKESSRRESSRERKSYQGLTR